MLKTYSMDLAGRNLTIETGELAGLANGNVLVRYGDTVVMVNVTASKEPKEGIDFFPLSVDYEEKLYAVGKIPGGFTKREGKAADKAILLSRAIDKSVDTVVEVFDIEQTIKEDMQKFMQTEDAIRDEVSRAMPRRRR